MGHLRRERRCCRVVSFSEDLGIYLWEILMTSINNSETMEYYFIQYRLHKSNESVRQKKEKSVQRQNGECAIWNENLITSFNNL